MTQKKKPGIELPRHTRSAAPRTDHPEGQFAMRAAEAVPYTSKDTSRPMTLVVFRYPGDQKFWYPTLNLTGGPTLDAADQPDGLTDGPFTSKMMFEDLGLPADADLRAALPGKDFVIQIHAEREGKWKGRARVIAYTPRGAAPEKVVPKMDAMLADLPDYQRPKWVDDMRARAGNQPTGIEVPTAEVPDAEAPADQEPPAPQPKPNPFAGPRSPSHLDPPPASLSIAECNAKDPPPGPEAVKPPPGDDPLFLGSQPTEEDVLR